MVFQTAELCFAEGDILRIIRTIDADGFYIAEHRISGKVMATS